MIASRWSRIFGLCVVALGTALFWTGVGVSSLHLRLPVAHLVEVSRVAAETTQPLGGAVAGHSLSHRGPTTPTTVGAGCVVAGYTRHVADAIETVRTERCRTLCEHGAFKRFAGRVADLETHRSQLSTGLSTNTGMLARSPTCDSQLETVRRAYRETVMAVPHYDDDYGDDFEESLRVEFGEEVACGFEATDTLTPQFKRLFVRGALLAADMRRSYVRTLERELDALDSAREAFEAAATALADHDGEYHRHPFGPLVARYEFLDAHARTCERVLYDRQRQRTNGWSGYDLDELHEYLYLDAATNYPILADGTSLLAALDEERRAVHRALVRRF
ncbi:hypothetical protein C2R22_15605 [Salinigranum rubrum]|uniref:DUF7260 domain-containing protein n=1 Tax=Salinigranum rubrum TaxID=755307 RepID=A0A2I8VLT5_9EURY|nr:hypothetical protein [Salinigranum rubrum]AUV82886.1 hypothetical protein C2R22_15605 [Salinigranum rubrum]